MRNRGNISGFRPITSANSVTAAHAYFMGHDGINRSTSETDIVGTSLGSGHLATTALDMQGTLGTALSANSGWLTLTGASDHCYGVALNTATEYAGLYNAAGAVLLFAQFSASISTNTNASPCAIGIGDGQGATGKATIRLQLDRANAKARMQIKGSDTASIETISATTGSAFSDNTVHGVAVYVDFTDNTYGMYHDGVEDKTGTSTQTVGSLAEAFSTASAANAFITVGGGVSAATFPTAALWEDQVRRAGIIGFSTPPSNVAALVTQLHGLQYVPYGMFRGEA